MWKVPVPKQKCLVVQITGERDSQGEQMSRDTHFQKHCFIQPVTQRYLCLPLPRKQTSGFAKISTYYFPLKFFNFFYIFICFLRDLGFHRCKYYRNTTQKSVKDYVSGSSHGEGSEYLHKSRESSEEQAKNPRELAQKLLKGLPLCFDKSQRRTRKSWHQLRFQELLENGVSRLNTTFKPQEKKNPCKK